MKAVFFDIDGTLFYETKGVPESTKLAIANIRKNGHKAFICTGRSRIMVPQDPILDIGFDGVVAACGLYGELDGKKVFDQFLSQEELQILCKAFRDHKTMYILEGTDYIYYDEETFVDDPNDWYIQFVRRNLSNQFVSIQYAEKHLGGVFANKASLVEMNGVSNEPLYKRFENDYEVMVHEFKVAEIVPKGFHKGKGVERMCAQLGIDVKDSIAVGDSINDVDMLKTAGFSVVMGNGTDVAKAHADFITKEVYDDGIYHAMEYLGLM